MKVLKNILSVFLVLTILNTFVGKTIHELFFHHHHDEIHCEAASTHHFHEQKSSSTDLVCSFNFSASLSAKNLTSIQVVLNELGERSVGFVQQFSQNLYLSLTSLRGPPTC